MVITCLSLATGQITHDYLATVVGWPSMLTIYQDTPISVAALRLLLWFALNQTKLVQIPSAEAADLIFKQSAVHAGLD